MEDNKLKKEIISLTQTVVSKESFLNNALYSLTADVAVKFAVYCRLEHPLVRGYDNGQLDTIFTKFITHIYNQDKP